MRVINITRSCSGDATDCFNATECFNSYPLWLNKSYPWGVRCCPWSLHALVPAHAPSPWGEAGFTEASHMVAPCNDSNPYRTPLLVPQPQLICTEASDHLAVATLWSQMEQLLSGQREDSDALIRCEATENNNVWCLH